mmetsp:Transcript_5493/g.10512  ORF Transcript_5493/g.10512 Transcript_5493/m.10512 type:complete len:206 (+) Transcript_5493:130-747(+)
MEICPYEIHFRNYICCYQNCLHGKLQLVHLSSQNNLTSLDNLTPCPHFPERPSPRIGGPAEGLGASCYPCVQAASSSCPHLSCRGPDGLPQVICYGSSVLGRGIFVCPHRRIPQGTGLGTDLGTGPVRAALVHPSSFPTPSQVGSRSQASRRLLQESWGGTAPWAPPPALEPTLLPGVWLALQPSLARGAWRRPSHPSSRPTPSS